VRFSNFFPLEQSGWIDMFLDWPSSCDKARAKPQPVYSPVGEQVWMSEYTFHNVPSGQAFTVRLYCADKERTQLQMLSFYFTSKALKKECRTETAWPGIQKLLADMANDLIDDD
jgi:hypothetical protein